MFLGLHHDIRQRSGYPEYHSSTNVSDVQESDDNFWLEQVRTASMATMLTSYFANGSPEQTLRCRVL